MPTRTCLDCGRPVLGPRVGRQGTRCPTHQREHERAKRAKRPRATQAEEQRRAQAIAQHVAVYGWWCPGWRRAPHPSTDLTADHIDPFAVTGREDGPLGVLCRVCNGAKSNRTTD